MATETQPVKSKKDSFRESYSKRHPDANFDDEESIYGGINEDYDNFDNEISTLKGENERYKRDQDDFINAMTSNKDNGAYVSGMMQGKDILETAIGIHGYDGLIEYLQSEEAREKYKEADAKHKEDLANSKKLDEEADANAEQTNKELADAIAAGRFTEEEKDKALEQLFDIADGLELNVCKPEWIEMVLAANNHDKDVDAAREEGRINGKNEGLEQNIRGRKKGAPQGQPSMPVNMGGRPANKEQKRGGSLASLLMGK